MIRPLMIIGAGGHSKVLIDTLRINGIPILGILEIDPSQAGRNVLGIPILGSDDELRKYSKDKILLVNAVGSVGDTRTRRKVFTQFKEIGFEFSQVIHPSAVIAQDSFMEEGVQVMAGTVIQAGAFIGENTIINTSAVIDHDCRIGRHVHIAPGAVLSGNVTIGSGSHIGTSSTIIQGISIGENVLIGAGAVVVHDIPSGVKAIGVPARIVSSDKQLLFSKTQMRS